jgi:DNA-binding transcriptional regulator/RsmH inhibitor MraZ
MPSDKEIIRATRHKYFTSVVDVTLDPNKRIVIPNKYIRQGLSKDCFLVDQSSGNYDFITIFTYERFDEYAQRYLERGDLSEREYLDRKRAFFSRVKQQKLSETKPRITLDLEMLEHLRIVEPSTTLALVGAGDTIEIWRRDKYNSWRDSEGAKVG